MKQWKSRPFFTVHTISCCADLWQVGMLQEMSGSPQEKIEIVDVKWCNSVAAEEICENLGVKWCNYICGHLNHLSVKIGGKFSKFWRSLTLRRRCHLAGLLL